MSQYLKRIEASMRAESDPYRQAECRALRALYLARLSRFAEAQNEIDGLRRDFGSGQSGRVTCLVMIAEGIKQHYESFSLLANDRLSRALFLGQAMRDAEIVALAATWKGFLDFEYSRFESMARTLSLAVDSWSEHEHSAKTRVFLMMMVASIALGKSEAAQGYFRRAHHHAVADGDQASIEALVFDKAAFALSRLRLEWALGSSGQERVAKIRLELESSRNLNRLVDIPTMADHVTLGLARAEWMAGDYFKAAAELEDFIGSKSFPTSHLNDSALRTELAYCHLLAGDLQRAQSFAVLVDVAELRVLDPDERVVLSKMLLALQHAEIEVLGASTLDEFAKGSASEHAAFESRLGEAWSVLAARLPESAT